MSEQRDVLNLTEKPKKSIPRKRRTAGQLEPFARKRIREEFEIRTAGADADIAKAYETQRSDVLSIVLHSLCRDLRDLRAMAWMRGAASPDKKQPQRERGVLNLVKGSVA